jgi:hypothetical protein
VATFRVKPFFSTDEWGRLVLGGKLSRTQEIREKLQWRKIHRQKRERAVVREKKKFPMIWTLTVTGHT